MNIKKRVLIILFLISFINFLFIFTNKYENKLENVKTKEIASMYAPFKKENNFKIENSERYVRYYEKNKNLSYGDIVTRVNIGLDYGFYEYIKDADINKENTILVNKYLKLNDYIPSYLENINDRYFINGNKEVRKLKKEAKEAFEKLSEASIRNNTPVYGQSAYRDYERQKYLYNEAVNRYGKTVADSDTARPGHSEHQTGLSIDVSSDKNGNMLSFEYTKSFTWMKDNAYKYGFILRYPKGKENVHGYIYESWHYRYVGVKIATDMYQNFPNLTFDEYYYMFLDNKKGL